MPSAHPAGNHALQSFALSYQPMNFGRPARTVVTVEDKETHDPLLGATVSIVSRADTLRGTTVKEDFYRIMAVYRCDRIFRDSVDLEVTYVGYKPFKKRYGNTGFRGRIEVKMEVDEQSIAQVVVVGQQVAMVFRGDTTVYNAGAFKTMADDRFAELLKQLPGVEIKDNKIYAEGQEVKRVLIDGKNLFGSKTSYALTDLEASDVRSVRVYEDFSPEAKRLGDNTAEKEKVMDVETKSKRGYILGGNLEGTLGASLERDYSGRHEIRHSEAGSFYRNTERGNWRLVRLEDDPHETDRRPGGLYPAPGRLDQRIDRRPVRSQPPEQHGVLADRIFPDRSLCPAQRGEPERIALEIAFGGDLELRQHPAEEEGFRGHDHLFDRRRLHTRAQPHAAADRRRKDPDEPQQQLRQTQHPIECQHFLPLENFRTVDPVVQRLGQIRTRRPGRLAGRHDGLDTRPAGQTAQRRRQPQLFVRRQSGLPLQTGKKGFGQRLIQLQPRLRPLETAGGRFPLRPAGRRRHGQLLPLHDRHLHAQPANQPAIPERRRLDNGRTGRSALRHRPQRALPQGGALPAAVLPAQPDGLPLGRQVAEAFFVQPGLLPADDPARRAALDAQRHQPPFVAGRKPRSQVAERPLGIGGIPVHRRQKGPLLQRATAATPSTTSPSDARSSSKTPTCPSTTTRHGRVRSSPRRPTSGAITTSGAGSPTHSRSTRCARP